MQSIPTELPLKYLSVAGRAVSEKSLKHFSKFSHLISLQLSANKVEGKGLNHLISLPFLERVLLYCDYCNEDVVDEKIKRIICSE